MTEGLPIAAATVIFKRFATGEQIGALVQRVVEENGQGVRFFVDERYYDGDVMSFGQTSGSPARSIRVVPSLANAPFSSFFTPTARYAGAVVVNHLESGSASVVGYSRKLIIEAVKAFAEALGSAYATALKDDSFPEYVPVRRVEIREAR